MVARIHFAGPIQYRVRSAAEIGQSILKVSARRMLKGPTPAQLELARGGEHRSTEETRDHRVQDA